MYTRVYTKASSYLSPKLDGALLIPVGTGVEDNGEERAAVLVQQPHNVQLLSTGAFLVCKRREFHFAEAHVALEGIAHGDRGQLPLGRVTHLRRKYVERGIQDAFRFCSSLMLEFALHRIQPTRFASLNCPVPWRRWWIRYSYFPLTRMSSKEPTASRIAP